MDSYILTGMYFEESLLEQDFLVLLVHLDLVENLWDRIKLPLNTSRHIRQHFRSFLLEGTMARLYH